jgi:transposase
VHLVELSVMEQRYQAVMAVIQDGWKITEVAQRLGVARQSVHNWIARYEASGLPALADRSHRPQTCAHQIAPGLSTCCKETGWEFMSRQTRRSENRR